MTTIFDRPLNGYRFAETNRGDTLQLIAARELGDAARWPELISYNNLVPPYITDDEALVSDGVLLSGALILVPAATAVISATLDPDEVFGIDIRLQDGKLDATDGDFHVVSGVENLKQALVTRVEVERTELMFHKTYGSFVRRLIGATNGPTAALLAAQYAKSAVLADDRILSVKESVAEVVGDQIPVRVVAEAVNGRPVEFSATP